MQNSTTEVTLIIIFLFFSVLVVLASFPWLNWKTPWLKSKKCSKREATLLNISHHPSPPIIERRKKNTKLENYYYYFSYSLRLDLSLNLFCTFWYIVLTYWKILTRTFFTAPPWWTTYYKFNYIFDKKLVNENDD